MSEDEIYRQALQAAQHGAFDKAESLARGILKNSPSHFGALTLLGEILFQSDRSEEALGFFEAAAKDNPGQSGLYTRCATIRFRLNFGLPVTPRPPGSPEVPRIQMTSLGSDGRFGNQLLQYAFTRLYAETYELSAEFPDWIGRDIFDLDDPLPSADLPQIDETQADFFASLLGKMPRVFRNVDIKGYFGKHTALWGARETQFRALFMPGKNVRPPLDRALETLRANGNTIVALHLRGADFGYSKFWVAPASWYVSWLREHWQSWSKPVLYLATDDANIAREFAEFSPWLAHRLGLRFPGIEFLVDHHILRNADYLAISNSTFSFTAAMLNTNALVFMRPQPDLRALVAFSPWNAEVDVQPVVNGAALLPGERAILAERFDESQAVVYVGRFCSPWTNFARMMHPRLQIVETEGGDTLDNFRRTKNIGHIHHVVVGEDIELARVISGGQHSFRHALVDMLHFRLPPALAVPREVLALKDHGYEIFRLAETSLEPAVGNAPIHTGKDPVGYVAMRRGVLSV